MNCQEVEHDLSAYVDGELSAPVRSAVDEHLKTCPHCQKRVAELKQLAAGLAALPETQTPSEFLKAVRGKLVRGEEPSDLSWQEMLFHSLWFKLSLATVVLVVLLALSTDFLQPMWGRRVDKTLAKAGDESAMSAETAATGPSKANEPSESRDKKDELAAKAKTAAEQAKQKLVEAPAAAPAPSSPAAAVSEVLEAKPEGYLHGTGAVIDASSSSPSGGRGGAKKLSDGRSGVVGRGRRVEKSAGQFEMAEDVELSNDRLVASNGVTILYLNEPPPAITVEAADPVAFETKVSLLANSLQGQVIGQDNTQTNMQKLFISIPAENLEAFKAQFGSVRAAFLSSLSLTGHTEAAQTGTNQTFYGMSPGATQTVVIITGGGSAAVVSDGDRSKLGEKPATVVLEIQVVPPKN